MESSTNSTLALIIALVAIIFGPVIQLFIARKQFSTQTSNLIRNEWAKELRNTVADYIAICYHHSEVVKLFRTLAPGSVLWEEIQVEKNKALSMAREANQLRFRIMTMLDQEDEAHCVLIDKMNDLRDLFDLPYSAEREDHLTLRVANLITSCNDVINYTYKQMFHGQ